MNNRRTTNCHEGRGNMVSPRSWGGYILSSRKNIFTELFLLLFAFLFGMFTRDARARGECYVASGESSFNSCQGDSMCGNGKVEMLPWEMTQVDIKMRRKVP